ncbi:MAG: transcriptional repressor [Planctomycetes bacterium]|nr:transcriptional repressor [Planctomycetota bacterium]
MSFNYEKNVHTEPGAEVAIFEAYLRERGLKLTQARRDLLNVIFSDHGHFTADDLYDRCRRAGLRVSKATLYRTLIILIDCKLLVDHDFGQDAKYFEHCYGHRHHDHMVCLACRGITEFRSEELERLQDHAAIELGFAPVRHSTTVFGVCAGCASGERGRQVLEEARRAVASSEAAVENQA